jgi:hypothetical protein
MVVKTDRKDARGIAQLLRMGWFRPVHCKSLPAQEIRTLLVGRKLLQGKLLDIELGIRGLLRGFGLKVGAVSKGRFVTWIRTLIAGQPMLERVIKPMLQALEALRAEFHALHRTMLDVVRHDAACRRLMTVPGVGALAGFRNEPLGVKPSSDHPRRRLHASVRGRRLGCHSMPSERSRRANLRERGSCPTAGPPACYRLHRLPRPGDGTSMGETIQADLEPLACPNRSRGRGLLAEAEDAAIHP